MANNTHRHFGVEPLERRRLLATATINWSDGRQTVDGFGASSAWFNGTIPAAGLSLLYSSTTGIGLSLLRSRITPDMGSSEGSIMQQAQALGAKVWSTPWTPPREWKTNQANNNGGSLLPAYYQDYANGLATYILNQRAAGVPLYAISLQNEPDYTATWETCIWNADQFAAFLPIVASTFAAKGITTKIMLAEQAGWRFTLLSKIAANPTLMQYVDIVGAHNYDGSVTYGPVPLAAGKRLWETEQSGGPTVNDMTSALPWATDIYKAFTNSGVNAWHYWWLQGGGSGGVLGSGYTATKRGWAIGNYSRFVRPGWQFVGSTNDSTLNISAFKDPVSGRFAIIAVNNGTAAINQTFNLNGFTASSVTPYVTSDTAGDDLAARAAINTAGGGASFVASVGAKSVVTYVDQLSAQPTLQAPQNLTVAVAQGNTKTQLALAWDDVSTTETAYTVERSPDGATWTPLTTTLPADTRTYVDTGLTENTAYSYRVRATAGASTSAYSSVVTGRTTLGAPYNLGIGTTATGTTVGWLDGTTGETKLTIDRSLNGLTWTTVASSLGPNTTYFVDNTIPSFNTNQTYFYRVRAFAGTIASTYVQANTGLRAPTGLNATTTPTTITASWTNVAITAGGISLEYYNVATAAWVGVSSGMTGSTSTYTWTGLTENTSRRIRVKALSAADSLSSGYAAEITALTPLLAPASLTATVTGPQQVRLNWTDASALETAYTVERSTNGTTWATLTSTLPAGSASYIDSTAASNVAYTYRVTATMTGNASAAASVSVTTPVFLAAPGPITIATPSAGRIEIAWTNNEPTATSNAVDYSTDNATWTTVSLPASATTYALSDLLGSTHYWFRVRAVAPAGSSANTLADTFTLSTALLPGGLDIGAPLPAGTDSYDAAARIYTVSAGGTDIWLAADQFRFLSQPFAGDGSMIARVLTQQNTNAWAKAGVMFRDSAAGESANVAVLVTPGNGITFQWRTSSGGTSVRPATLPAGTAPAWVKLTRRGAVFTAWYSTNAAPPRASDWVQIGTAQTVPLATMAQVGLAVTSHVAGTAGTATFGNVNLYAAPAATAMTFDPTVDHVVNVSFSGALNRASLAADDLIIANLSTGQTYTATSLTVSTLGTSASFVLPTSLADGNYRFTLPATAWMGIVGDIASSDLSLQGPDVFVLAADANGNRSVDFSDLLVLAQHYGESTPTLTFAQGDFNYDLSVDFSDLLILAQHYGTSLAALAALPATGSSALATPALVSGPVARSSRRSRALETISTPL